MLLELFVQLPGLSGCSSIGNISLQFDFEKEVLSKGTGLTPVLELIEVTLVSALILFLKAFTGKSNSRLLEISSSLVNYKKNYAMKIQG